MEPDLIDSYVVALRQRLAWRRDVDDVTDEVADHLREHAERFVAQGIAAEEAQRRTLECFGDLGLIARTFAQTPSGELAVPSRATRLAGAAGIGAGLLWPACAVAAAAGGHTGLITPWTQERYWIWVALLAVTIALTTLALAGALARTGRVRTPIAAAALGTGVLLTALMSVVGWAVTLLMTLLGVAVLVALRGDSGDAARVVRPLRILAVWVLGAASLLLFDEVVRLGPVDEYGDYQIAWLVPFVVCALCSAWALTATGSRLRAERPADLQGVAGSPVAPTVA